MPCFQFDSVAVEAFLKEEPLHGKWNRFGEFRRGCFGAGQYRGYQIRYAFAADLLDAARG